MKDPDRLLASSHSEVERLLLRAGRESAPRGAKRRALAAATGVIAASTLTAGNATGAALAGKAAAGAKAATFLSLKWIVVVGVTSVGVAASTVAVRAVRMERAVSSSVATAISTPARPRASGASGPLPSLPPPSTAPESASTPVAPAAHPAARVASEAVLPGELPPAPPSVAAPASARVSALAATPAPVAALTTPPAVPRTVPPAAPAVASAPPARPAGSIGSSSAAELAMLDEARAAIDHREPARGLSVLGAYARRFPRGVMGPEASILRIEALVNVGDRVSARREGDEFLRANPTSPYAPRIASLLGARAPNP